MAQQGCKSSLVGVWGVIWAFSNDMEALVFPCFAEENIIQAKKHHQAYFVESTDADYALWRAMHHDNTQQLLKARYANQAAFRLPPIIEDCG